MMDISKKFISLLYNIFGVSSPELVWWLCDARNLGILLICHSWCIALIDLVQVSSPPHLLKREAPSL